MKRLLMFVLAATLGPVAHADPHGEELPAVKPGVAAVDPAVWKGVLDKVRTRGDYNPPDEIDDGPANYALWQLRGDAAKAHQADYINLRGKVSRGEFAADKVTMVSEDWSIPADGNWHIDQWIFWLDLEGGVRQADHRVLVETMDRTVLDTGVNQARPGDTAIAQKLGALMTFWQVFEPKNPPPRPPAEVIAPGFPKFKPFSVQYPGEDVDASALRRLKALASRAELATRRANIKNFYVQDGRTYFFTRLWACREPQDALRLSLMLLKRGACREAFNLDATSRLEPDRSLRLVSLELGTLRVEGGGQDDLAAIQCLLFGLCEPRPGKAPEYEKPGPSFTLDPDSGALAAPLDESARTELRRVLDFWTTVDSGAL